MTGIQTQILVKSLLLQPLMLHSVTRCLNKKRPNFLKSCPKIGHSSFIFYYFFTMSQKSANILGYLCGKVCCHQLWKIAQSGHTGPSRLGGAIFAPKTKAICLQIGDFTICTTLIILDLFPGLTYHYSYPSHSQRTTESRHNSLFL